MAASVRENFMDQRNEQMLGRLLYQDIQRRTGETLNEKQKERLVKTVRHYMGEVVRVNTRETSIQVLNKEVLTSVIPDFMSYMRRASSETDSKQASREIMSQDDPLKQDIGTRLQLLQDERNEGKVAPPSPPDFRIALEDDGPTAAEAFERIKKQREAEAARDLQIVDRQMRPQEAEAIVKPPRILTNEISNLPLPPDMRAVLFGVDKQQEILAKSGLGTANPTIAVPEKVNTRPVLPQDFVQKEDDIINYKENEFNLHVYSADRNWLVNTGESRYNFSVNFNPGNITGATFRPNPATQIKFKNITRIELVKALIPVEGVQVLIDRDASGSGFTTSVNTNALSFPYLMVRVPELDTNNYGTNYNIDNAFGVIQYDANWFTDSQNVVQRNGFLAMIPKFLKCQRVYYPTPLATLQKMSIQLQRPDGNLVSDTLDTLDISGFVLSNSIASTYKTQYAANGAAAGYSQYIWISTKTYFSRFMFTVGDRIQLKGTAFASNFAGNTAVSQAFISFLERPEGHLVVNVGRYAPDSYGVNFYTTGVNTVGYANFIIIDAQYNDPTTGSTSIAPFGGVATNTFATALVGATGSVAAGKLINLSRQVQLCFRVITRDFDGASRLRPDNLN